MKYKLTFEALRNGKKHNFTVFSHWNPEVSNRTYREWLNETILYYEKNGVPIVNLLSVTQVGS